MSAFEPERPDEHGPEDESGIARVLRAAGGRIQPSPEMKESIRAAVHAEWRAAVRARKQKRVLVALAASVLIVALALWMSRLALIGPPDAVATVSRSIGTVQTRSATWSGWRVLIAPREARGSNVVLHAGDDIRTGADGRIALRWGDGVSVRLDRDTRVALENAGRIEVSAGAIYVDAGPVPATSRQLEVVTPAGIVRHVGTQYEVRLVNGSTRIRVREGSVSLLSEQGGAQTARVGEQLLVLPSGTIERSVIAPSDPEWAWVANTAPAFDIDGRSVRDFLTWVGRELGRPIVFATPESEAEADRAILSGSVEGLSPAEALAAVLPTTRLVGTQHDGKIEISLASSGEPKRN